MLVLWRVAVKKSQDTLTFESNELNKTSFWQFGLKTTVSNSGDAF